MYSYEKDCKKIMFLINEHHNLIVMSSNTSNPSRYKYLEEGMCVNGSHFKSTAVVKVKGQISDGPYS